MTCPKYMNPGSLITEPALLAATLILSDENWPGDRGMAF